MTLVKRQNGNHSVPSSLHSFFDDFFTRDLFDWNHASATSTTVPRVNILESDDDFRVEMAAPGMRKKDFRIELDNHILTISSDYKHEETLPEGHHYRRREFSHQSFQRTFHLPDTVDNDKIKAHYENGILRLTIPKKDEARRRPSRVIQVS
jgi:HSP20 family protein